MKNFGAFLVIIATASRLVAQPIVSESKFLDVDHLKVHYTNYGKGDTALFFVHGWSCDETVWSEQAPALAEKIRVITIDLPGHGQSEKPKTIEYTMDLYARAIDAVLSDATVKSHVARILFKLNLRDRTQAVVVAYETGLIAPGATG